MSIKYSIEEDVSEGFDKLQARVSEDMKHILSEMMIDATGTEGEENAPIPRRLMYEPKPTEYNPYLFMSGQDRSRWDYNINEDESSVIANYSGMEHRTMRPPEDEFMVWWEFSEEYDPEMPQEEWYILVFHTDPTERTLDRDYAFYQETGVDKYAKPEHARHKGFVNRGMGDASEKMGYTLKTNIVRILKML